MLKIMMAALQQEVVTVSQWKNITDADADDEADDKNDDGGTAGGCNSISVKEYHLQQI